MSTPRRTGLRRLWYVASWRARYWWMDSRAGFVTRAALSIGVLVAACLYLWHGMTTPAPAGDPAQAWVNWVVQIVIMIVSALISMAMAPKPQDAKAQKIEVSRVEDGATLKRIYGPVWITDPIEIGKKNLGTVPIRKRAGKSISFKTKWQTVGHWYLMAFHFMLGRGPIDRVLAIRVGDIEAWTGDLTASGSITVSRPNLWGGEDAEGGIDGTFEFMFGEADQLPNPWLAANLGPEQSAYRGRASVVFKGGKWGNSPYFKSPAFLVSRILKGWDGGACWYPEKAQVLIGAVSYPYDGMWSYRVEPPGSSADYSASSYDHSAWETGLGGFGSQAPPASSLSIGTFIPGGIGKAIWIRRMVAFSGDIQIDVYHDDGAWLWVDGVPIELENISYFHSRAMLHISGSTAIALKVVDGVPGGSSNIFAGIAFLDEGSVLHAMNVAHVLYDSLTSHSMDGEPVGLVDDASWRFAADRLHAEGLGIGTIYDSSAETIEQFQQRLCDIAGARMSRDPTTGKWHLDLIRDDIGIVGLPVLTDDDIIEFERQPSILDEAVNQVVVEWHAPLRKEDRSTAPLQALGAIQAFGSVNGEVRTYREILAEDTALRLADRDLRVRATPLERITATTTRVPYAWRSGQKFRLQAPKHGVADMVCLLGGDVDRGTLRSGALRISAMQDVGSMATTTYVTGEPGIDTGSSQVALPAPVQRGFEVPYRDLAELLSTADLAFLPASAGYAALAAVNPGAALDFQLWTRIAPDDYSEAIAGAWCPSAVIVEACTVADPAGGLLRTAFTFTGATGLADVALGTAALWGDEIVRVDALDGLTGAVTLARGCGDTVPQPHPAGARIWFYDADLAMDPVQQAAPAVIDAKARTRTGADLLALGSAPESSVPMASRQARPYPPGQFQVNGETYPETVFIAAALTWVHRDRIAQAAQVVAAGAASIGPEPGTTYTARWYLDAVLVDEQTGITGTTATFAPAANGVLVAEVWAVRDGLMSWQAARHECDFRVLPLAQYENETADTYADENGDTYEG